MSSEVVQLPFRVTEFNEDMVIAVEKNFREIERLLGILQVYMNKTGKPADEKADTVIDDDYRVGTEYLEGQIDALQNMMVAGAGSVTITEENGIMIVDDKDNPTRALRLLGGIFGIANSKNPDNTWNWRTFGTGDGFTADEIVSGTIHAGVVIADGVIIGGVPADQLAESAKTVTNPYFEQGKLMWGSGIPSLAGEELPDLDFGTIIVGGNYGGKVLEIQNDETIGWKYALPANANHVYKYNIVIRQTINDSTEASSMFLLGLEYMDENYAHIGSNSLVSESIKSSDGWKTYTNKIEGSVFPANTVYIRPFIRVNIFFNDSTQQLDCVEFIDVTETDNAVKTDEEYNSVTINKIDGVKCSHDDGSYTQLTGDGLKRHTALPIYQYTSTGVPTKEDFNSTSLGTLPDGWTANRPETVVVSGGRTGNCLYLESDFSDDARWVRVIKDITQDNVIMSFWTYFYGDTVFYTRFSLDGVPYNLTETPETWVQTTITIPKAGKHVFQWEMYQPSDQSANLKIDDVVFEADPKIKTIVGYDTAQGNDYLYTLYMGEASNSFYYSTYTDTDETYIPTLYITLPDEFKGTNFKIFLAVKDCTRDTADPFAGFKLYVESIDYENAIVAIRAYVYYNFGTGGERSWSGLGFTYFVSL